MSVDFFVFPCNKEDGNCKKEGVKCKSVTNFVRFGISDRNSDKREPAFLDLKNEDIWDLVVENPDRKVVVFKAIDFCVEIFRYRNELIKRCEGFFLYDNKILFLELKVERKVDG